MTSQLRSFVAAAVAATAAAAAGCGNANKPAPRNPAAVTKDQPLQPEPASPVAGGKLQYPRKKAHNAPPYPEALRTQGIEGDVSVMLSLDESGKVVKVAILKESPYPEFNEAALKTAMRDEFEPAMRDGVPIATSVRWTYRWRR